VVTSVTIAHQAQPSSQLALTFLGGPLWALSSVLEGGSSERSLDSPRVVSVIWHGEESDGPDASNFDFDESRITQNCKN
jgi:hypothetical protein